MRCDKGKRYLMLRDFQIMVILDLFIFCCLFYDFFSLVFFFVWERWVYKKVGYFYLKQIYLFSEN